MGTYIDIGNSAFSDYRNDCYVDKTELIEVINKTLNTQRRYSCVTRCRRFGKSMAANMLCAYYDKSCDSRELFADLQIGQSSTFTQHLNKYPVLYLDVTSFTSRIDLREKLIDSIQEEIEMEVKQAYPNVLFKENSDLMDILSAVHNQTDERFIFIIDEWDAICREFPERQKMKGSPETVKPTILDKYVMLLRRLFKTQASDKVFAGVYLTGILPMKKYNTESALNNFREYSMIDPKTLAPYFGFTEKEVEELVSQSRLSIEEIKSWYDGYQIGKENSIYNPYSVMEALYSEQCSNYWQKTGAYDSVKTYIQSNFEGLKDDILKMLSGDRVSVNTTKFQNDMHIITCKDDVLTVLIHLGYLSYDSNTKKCFMPNKEVAEEFTNAIEATNWTSVSKTLQNSEKLLDDTLAGKEENVAKAIDLAHDENTSILSYNDENSLSCVLSIAYIWAKNDYIIHREFATGKGFADLVMIPRKNTDKPALIVELKYDQSVETAINQIKNKNYPEKIREYTGNILLVSINYNKKAKKHTCKIEHLVKD